jgi:molybdopterin converting factor small subunit
MAAADRAETRDETTITLRYWAAARSAAGTDLDVVPAEGAEAITLAALMDWARALHEDSSRFADVLGCCSVMVGDRPVTTDDPMTVLVPPGATVEFLPPFAGG